MKGCEYNPRVGIHNTSFFCKLRSYWHNISQITKKLSIYWRSSDQKRFYRIGSWLESNWLKWRMSQHSSNLVVEVGLIKLFTAVICSLVKCFCHRMSVRSCGLHYKHITIVSDASRVVSTWRSKVCDHNWWH